jgi:hypothetical protein
MNTTALSRIRKTLLRRGRMVCPMCGGETWKWRGDSALDGRRYCHVCIKDDERDFAHDIDAILSSRYCARMKRRKKERWAEEMKMLAEQQRDYPYSDLPKTSRARPHITLGAPLFLGEEDKHG